MFIAINDDEFRYDSENDISDDKYNHFSKVDPSINFNSLIEQPTDYTVRRNEHNILEILNQEENTLLNKDNEVNFTKKKRGPSKESGLHNKFSDDNVRRKCKHIILSSLMKFINEKISKFYNKKIGYGIYLKKLLTLNQDQKADATVQFNKLFLGKTLQEIFSANITTRFTIYPLDHNKLLINDLLNEGNKEIRNYFQRLFNLTFLQSLEHFRGTCYYNELEGLEGIDYINEKYKDQKEYLETLRFYLNNYEEITNSKRERKRRRKKIKNNEEIEEPEKEPIINLGE